MSSSTIRMVATSLLLLVSAVGPCRSEDPHASALAGAGSIPGTEVSLDELTSDLDWDFEVATTALPPDGGRWAHDGRNHLTGTRSRFRSREPLSTSSSGTVHLHLLLTTGQFADPTTADAAFESMLRSADPDTGLSYAWDHVSLRGDRLYHLHAECTLAEARFAQVVAKLRAALETAAAAPLRTMDCRCGGGCAVRHTSPGE